MPKKEIKLNVFVASPSDVDPERELIHSVCKELNSVWGSWIGLNLSLKTWQDNTYPGVSDYSQNVINEQIDDDYDIFIALFWNRFGTPTPKAKSGTKEELDRAFLKFEKQNDSVDVMVYFKKQVEGFDTSQQKLVRQLRDDLGSKGTYYFQYQETKDFESLLRIHLSFVAQKWSKKLDLSESNKKIENLSTSIELNGLSLQDYYSIFTARSEVIRTLTLNIATIYKFNMDEFQKFIKKSKGLYDKEDINEINFYFLRYIKIYLASVEDTTNIINAQLEPLKHARGVFFEVLSKIISMEINIGFNKRISVIKKSITTLMRTHRGAKDSLVNYTNNLKKSYFKENHQTIEMIIVFEEYEKEINEFIILSKALLDVIDEMRS